MELAVTAGPEEEEESETRAAICIRHQTGNQELYFCFDCTRVFCTYCQLADGSRTNHKPHRTSKLKDLLRIRKERIAQLRTQLKQFSAKHEATTNAANQLEAEKNVQLQTFYDAIDEFANRIHQEVDDLKATARRHLLKRAQQMWENSPVASLHTVAEETLSHVRQVRDSLELEIRRAEADELAMAVGRIEMDALGDQLAAFLDAQVELPERSAFDLTSLRSQLHASVSQLEAEVSRSKETFIRSLHKRELFPNPERVRLVEQQTFHQQELVLPADQNQSPNINSVTHEEDTDIIYFTDEFNPSKIKALNLKTRQLSEVFSRPSNVVLYGLFTASDRPNRPFIVTTEQTISAPVPTICVNVLRRNALGQLAIVQEMKLHESSTNPWTTFASGPNGSVFCAIWGSNSVHQMCRARAPGVAAVAAPFAEVSTRAHRLSATVYYIGGLECDGEQRLVGSFADKSVRVFREASGELCEVQRVAAPANNWSPNTLVGLSDDGICVRSYHTDSADLTQAFTIELCAADTSGALSSSRRLAKFVNHVEVWCHLRAPYAFDSSHRIVVAEYVNATTVALRLFHIQEC